MKISIATTWISIFALASLLGCKKQLKEFNPSGNTPEVVFTTPLGYESLVNAAYSYTKSWYGKEDGFGMAEMGTDLWTAGSETYGAASGLAGDNRSLVLYQNLNPVNGNVTRLWKQLYAAVNLCNGGIKISQDGSFAPPATSVAELHFLRAFYNWHIVETWGGVHLTTEPSTIAVTTANRTPETAFYQLMESDLNTAIANLPETAKTYGKVNKNIAKAFLARVYLTWGYKDNSKFPLAKALAEEVMAKYPLVKNYADLWDMKKQKSNSEVIWSVNYSNPSVVSDVYDQLKNPNGYGSDILSNNGTPTNNRGNNNAHPLFIPIYDKTYALFENQTLNRDIRNGWPFARFKPTLFLLNLYDETKDARFAGSFQTTWLLNKKAEKRLAGKVPYKDTAWVIAKNPTPSANYYTVDVATLYNADGSSKGENIVENALFPALLKFKDSTRSANPSDVGSGNIQGTKDVFVIRAAEMYLISAEASVMMGQMAEAVGPLNALRTTRALPGADLNVDAAAVNLDFVLDERAREFAGEQIRWFDLKRTGKLVERVTKYNPDAGRYIQPYHIYRPIPQQQMDVVTNKGEFYQNSGY